MRLAGDRALSFKQVLRARRSRLASQTSIAKQMVFSESKEWNADGDSSNRNWNRIVAEQNHERSAIGEEIRFYQSLA